MLNDPKNPVLRWYQKPNSPGTEELFYECVRKIVEELEPNHKLIIELREEKVDKN
jgi:hypothetical protein